MEARLQKELVVGLSAVAVTMLEFFVANQVIGAMPSTAGAVTLLAVSLLWVLVATFAIGLAERWYTVVAIVATTALGVVLGGLLSLGATVGAALAIVLLLLARRFITGELENRVQYRTGDVFFAGLKMMIVALIVALAGMSLPSLEQSLASGQLAITAGQVSSFIQPVMDVFGWDAAAPGAGSTIDSLIDQQLSQQGIDAASVTPEQRAAARAEIGQRLQVPVSGEETVSDVAASRVHLWLSTLAESNPFGFAIGVLVLVIVTIRAFVPLLAWALLTPLALSVWVARRVGLARVVETTQAVERLRF